MRSSRRQEPVLNETKPELSVCSAVCVCVYFMHRSSVRASPRMCSRLSRQQQPCTRWRWALHPSSSSSRSSNWHHVSRPAAAQTAAAAVTAACATCQLAGPSSSCPNQSGLLARRSQQQTQRMAYLVWRCHQTPQQRCHQQCQQQQDSTVRPRCIQRVLTATAVMTRDRASK